MFEIAVELLLALLKVDLHLTERRLQQFVLAALNDVLCFESTLHVLQPDLVDGFEELGFSGQVLCDIARCEHRDEVGPKGLYLQPFFNDVSDVRKQGDLVSDFGLEGLDVLHSVHLVELVKMFFQLFLDVEDVAS